MMAIEPVLRPAQHGDEAFLRRVYADVRAPEVALTGWDDANAAAFLRMQFDARQHHYRTYYPHARSDIVECAGVLVGCLGVARTDGEIRIVDIALLAEYRNRGIGGTLLRSLLDEAARGGRHVTLHVEENNPALALYRRLGFTGAPAGGLHRLMTWRPAPAIADDAHEIEHAALGRCPLHLSMARTKADPFGFHHA